jgi:branched-chain amino acid transport system permease protein
MTESAIKVGDRAGKVWLGGWARVALEALFWCAAFGAIFVLPRKLLLLNDVAITALFALSLDLILGVPRRWRLCGGAVGDPCHV